MCDHQTSCELTRCDTRLQNGAGKCSRWNSALSANRRPPSALRQTSWENTAGKKFLFNFNSKRVFSTNSLPAVMRIWPTPGTEEELYTAIKPENSFPLPVGGRGPIRPLRCSSVSLHGVPFWLSVKSDICMINILVSRLRFKCHFLTSESHWWHLWIKHLPFEWLRDNYWNWFRKYQVQKRFRSGLKPTWKQLEAQSLNSLRGWCDKILWSFHALILK